MSPILGIWASSQQPALNASSYESIATVTVGSGGSSTITFSSIPSTYKHLQVRALYLENGSYADIRMQLNSDTGSNYAWHFLYGDGSSAGASATSNGTNMDIATGGTSTYPGVFVADILDYTNTNKYKTVRTLGGADGNGTGYVDLTSGLWLNTAAVSTISLFVSNQTINQYSSFALYGIK